MPKNIGDVLKRYRKILVPELNAGQLALAVAGAIPRGRRRPEQDSGRPFLVSEIEEKIEQLLS